MEREITAATAAIKRQKTKEFRSSENEHDVTEHCTVKVTGLPDGVSKDSILNYFENVRRSHGGPVSNVNMKPEIQMCLVTFESSDGKLLWMVAFTSRAIPDIVLTDPSHEGCVRLGNPDLDFENLKPDFPIERKIRKRISPPRNPSSGWISIKKSRS